MNALSEKPFSGKKYEANQLDKNRSACFFGEVSWLCLRARDNIIINI